MTSTIARIFANLPATPFSSAMQGLVEADRRHREARHIRRLSAHSLDDVALTRTASGQLVRG